MAEISDSFEKTIPDLIANVAIWAFAKGYELADDSGTKHESDDDWFLALGADWVASPDTSDTLRQMIEKHFEKLTNELKERHGESKYAP